VSKLARGHDQEFTMYVAGSWDRLRSRAFTLCHDWDHAADLVQSALVLAYVRWILLEKVENRDAYVTTIMARLHFRERRAPRWTAEIPMSELPQVGTIESYAEVVDDRLLLADALAQLGPRQRAVVALRLLHDLRAEEVARILTCRPSTVRSQTQRALLTLRKILSDAVGDDSR
jgi:RNA polymerase sigma factor (sigma-70 family)